MFFLPVFTKNISYSLNILMRSVAAIKNIETITYGNRCSLSSSAFLSKWIKDSNVTWYEL